MCVCVYVRHPIDRLHQHTHARAYPTGSCSRRPHRRPSSTPSNEILHAPITTHPLHKINPPPRSCWARTSTIYEEEDCTHPNHAQPPTPSYILNTHSPNQIHHTHSHIHCPSTIYLFFRLCWTRTSTRRRTACPTPSASTWPTTSATTTRSSSWRRYPCVFVRSSTLSLSPFCCDHNQHRTSTHTNEHKHRPRPSSSPPTPPTPTPPTQTPARRRSGRICGCAPPSSARLRQ